MLTAISCLFTLRYLPSALGGSDGLVSSDPLSTPSFLHLSLYFYKFSLSRYSSFVIYDYVIFTDASTMLRLVSFSHTSTVFWN